MTGAEVIALKKESDAIHADEAALAADMRADGGRDGAFIEPAFTRSESQAIESTLSDRGLTVREKAVDRSRTGGQFGWVANAKAGNNAVGTFAKVQPRFTHEQANALLASKKMETFAEEISIKLEGKKAWLIFIAEKSVKRLE